MAGRTRGFGCPFCSGRRVSVTNSLLNLYPDVAEEWHPTRNGSLTLGTVVATSEKHVWWVCERGPDHVWQATLRHRTVNASGCPFCAGKRASVTNSLGSLEPSVAGLWHPTKNGELTPHDVTRHSSKRVWWKCRQGPDHEWQAGIQDRVRDRAACAFCAGRRASVTNSLASLSPKIAEVSRTTISNYLGALEATFVVHVIRPFNSHRPSEIVSAPKVYAFAIGFVSYHRGWSALHGEATGLLWEHLVLNELHAHLQLRRIFYWRDKRQHQVDFVLPARRRTPVAIERKWSASRFDARHIQAFRRAYPEGDTFVVCSDVDRPYRRAFGEAVVDFIGLSELIRRLSGVS